MTDQHLTPPPELVLEWDDAELGLLREYLQLDPTVPSGLRWIKHVNNSVRVGQPAGSRTPDGYYNLKLKGRHYKCHRIVLLLNGVFPPAGHCEVDHMDRNPSNNLLSNLRWCTRGANERNKRSYGRCAFRYVRPGCAGRWLAGYAAPGQRKSVHVGTYDTPYEAHIAALAHRLEHHWNP